MKNNVFLCRLVIRLHPSIFVDHDIDCGTATGDSFFCHKQGYFPKKLFIHLKCQCKCQFVPFLKAISAGNQFLSLLITPCGVATGCGSIHGGKPALSALKYFGPNIRDTEHKAYLSPFPYDVL